MTALTRQDTQDIVEAFTLDFVDEIGKGKKKEKKRLAPGSQSG